MPTDLVAVQSAMIARIKDVPDILALLGSVKEVRELEWNGTDFTFPNVRVKIDEFMRSAGAQNCERFDVVASVMVFGDEASSLKINRIASSLFRLFDGRAFSQNGVPFFSVRAKQFGADWVEEAGVWKGELQLIFQVS